MKNLQLLQKLANVTREGYTIEVVGLNNQNHLSAQIKFDSNFPASPWQIIIAQFVGENDERNHACYTTTLNEALETVRIFMQIG